jgi:hypothetical protein
MNMDRVASFKPISGTQSLCPPQLRVMFMYGTTST